jgi:hypothetical protein
VNEGGGELAMPGQCEQTMQLNKGGGVDSEPQAQGWGSACVQQCTMTPHELCGS